LKQCDYSAVEAAGLLGVSERTIRRAIQRGELQATKSGRSFAIGSDDLEDFSKRLSSARTLESDVGQVSDPQPDSLQGYSGPLVGREHDLSKLLDLLRSPGTRLATLAGAGGVGKTRLALAAAGVLEPDMPDGVIIASLAPVLEPSGVPAAVAQAGKIFPGSRLASDAVIDALSQRAVLLLLDNFEHVLPAREFVEQLLDATGTMILVTSREALGLAGERVFPVASLALPARGSGNGVELHRAAPSVRLFVDRAREVDPAFSLNSGNATAIAEIVRRVDGLPLAIELAAARSGTFTPDAMLDRLQERLPLLVGGSRNLPLRHQTLRDAIDWSYALLSPLEQASFARLAAAPGGFDTDLASRLLDDLLGEQDTANDVLARLVAASLVRQDGAGRFSMLETIREYGASRLEASGGTTVARIAMVDHYVVMTSSFAEAFERTRQVSCFDQITPDLENIRVAFQWAAGEARSEATLKIAANLAFYWVGRGLYREGRELLDKALAIGGPVDLRNRIVALCEVGMLAERLSDYPAAEAAYLEAFALVDTSGIRHLHTELTVRYAVLKRDQGHLDEAIQMLQASLAEAEQAKDLMQISNIENNLGLCHIHQGDLLEARAAFERSLDYTRSIGDVRRMANTLNNMGMVSTWLSELDEAAGQFREAFELHTRGGDEQGRCISLMNYASNEIDRGNLERGIPMTEEAIAGLRQLGERTYVAIALANLADAEAARGDMIRALDLAMESLQLFERMSNHVYLAEVLEITGRLLADLKCYREAVTAFGVAGRYWAATGATRDTTYQERHSQAVSASRDALGLVEYQRLFDDAKEKPVGLVAAMTQSTIDAMHRAAANERADEREFVTPRELDVLRLLADGLTDQQIADQLFLSKRTVSTHVANLLNKLDVDSRTAAASVAIRQGLIA
jgi:excisionase family DNA binding protein